MDVCFQFIFEYILGGKSVPGEMKTNRSATCLDRHSRTIKTNRVTPQLKLIMDAFCLGVNSGLKEKGPKSVLKQHDADSLQYSRQQVALMNPWLVRYEVLNVHLIITAFRGYSKLKSGLSAIRTISAITSSELTAHNAVAGDTRYHMLLSSGKPP